MGSERSTPSAGPQRARQMTATLLAGDLFARYEEFARTDLRPFNCKHARIVSEMQQLVRESGGLLNMRRLGDSLEGRTINLVSCGTGKTTVLLWSQMHGDEPTATLAMMDMFAFLASASHREPWVRSMLSDVCIHAIPMLNPDGAERLQRHTAVQIDMNRDARAGVTPEGTILRSAQRTLNPLFGFNLHDQALSSVGMTPKVAALALLAPAGDEARSLPLTRVRAMRVAALIVQSLQQFIGGHMASYDDTFEPRAFGDTMQGWGTSTVLIESGHWPGDPEKKFVRKLNVVALLCALRSIGNQSYQDTELEYYQSLKPNGKRIYDYILHGLLLEYPGGWSHRVDVGLEVDPKNNPWPADGSAMQPVVTVKEIGDLHGFGALEPIDARGRRLAVGALALEQSLSLEHVFDLLQMYHGT